MNSERADCFCPVGTVLLAVFCLQLFCGEKMRAAESESDQDISATRLTNGTEGDLSVSYNVQAYVIEGKTLVSTNVLASLFSKYTGKNVSLAQIMRAAADLEMEYRRQGNSAMNISITQKRISNGIVTLNAFQGTVAQIMVSGDRYLITSNGWQAVAPPADINSEQKTVALASEANILPPRMVSTNSGPKFKVENYLVDGNTLLSPETISQVFTNVAGAFGPAVTFNQISATLTALQGAYHERGFVTVSVTLPQQKLTNATVRVKVIEGKLVAVNVKGNRWYGEQNIRRALPSLHTNMFLNNIIFQRELDIANASRDRSIYPVIGPGPDPGTSELTLKVKDQFPLHARMEINNDNTPGTPDLRVNSSIQYDNLWDRDQQLGLQYSFSVNEYKNSGPYDITFFNEPFIDDPKIDNYSAYYRIPLGGYVSVQQLVDQNPSKFGYDEVMHKFTLPQATGRPEFTLYASRSTTDTGVQLGGFQLVSDPSNPLVQIGQQTAQENVTLNEGMGGKLTLPLPPIKSVVSTLSLGMDYKHYELRSANANLLFALESVTNNGVPIKYGSPAITLQEPIGESILDYLPFNVGLNGSAPDEFGVTFFNAQANFNVLPILSGNKDFGAASYTTNARSRYVTVQMGADRDQKIYQGWAVKLHADGQWADGPLFNNEQYGMGGVAGVRGYLAGQDYGDTGWRMTVEPHTPPMNIGMVDGNQPFWVRASTFVDYGETYRLVEVSGPYDHKFLGTGFGMTANIGTHWDARLTLAWPLISNNDGTPVGQVHVYFGIGAQF